MDVAEEFEEWDPLDERELDQLLNTVDETVVVDDVNMAATGARVLDIESENSSDSDDEAEVFRCSKCHKVYHVKGWLFRHESTCNGAKETKKQAERKMSESQQRAREVLRSLGFQEYFADECLPIINRFLQEISSTPSSVVELRGKRFDSCLKQSTIILTHHEDDRVVLFLQYVAQTIWIITFEKDFLVSTSRRQQHIAEHLHAFRQSSELLLKWKEVGGLIKMDTTDSLLLQQLITIIFESTAQHHRSKSVAQALQIREDYPGERSSKPCLNDTERAIVAYIAGYVCRKVRDRLNRYCTSNAQSQQPMVQCKRERLGILVETLNTMIPGGVAHPVPSMKFPNLLTVSLSRGGLTQVDQPTYNLFCYLEVSIRPFLNLARFRSSTRNSDTKLLAQLIENSSLLQESWGFSKTLSKQDSNLLLSLFVDLYFRVRKWAYLKVYKEHRKLKVTQELLRSASKSAATLDLHGKDSIRKVLMSQTE